MSVMMAPLGGIMMAVLFAQVIHIMHRLTSLQDIRSQRFTMCKQALRSMNVPRNLTQRILSYQHFLNSAYDPSAVSVLFEHLSEPLTLELKLTLFRKLIA